jgi:hypothetical protein
MYIIIYVIGVSLYQVGSSPPSFFRCVNSISFPVDQVFSLSPVASSYILPETIPGTLSLYYATMTSTFPFIILKSPYQSIMLDLSFYGTFK